MENPTAHQPTTPADPTEPDNQPGVMLRPGFGGGSGCMEGSLSWVRRGSVPPGCVGGPRGWPCRPVGILTGPRGRVADEPGVHPEALRARVRRAEIDAGGAVKANYTGWQWDGTDPFDTSFKSGAPVTFPLGNVIQGWKCGLAGHHVGDRVVMSIPPELAYGNKAAQDAQAAQAGGAQQQGQQNPAGTLVFVVEIVDGVSGKISGGSASATMEGEEAVSQRGITVSGELGQPAKLSIGADAAQPAKSEVIVLARGSGPAIKENSTAVMNIAGNYWDGSQPSNTWEQHAAESINMAQAQQSVPGLIGVPEGSRIVVLMPPVQATGQQQGGPASAYVMDVEKVF